MGAGGILAGIQAGGQLYSAHENAQAIKAQGQFQKQIFQINSEFANLQADDAISRGGKEAASIRDEGKKVIGSQRAILAAQGIEIDSGSALAIQEETAARTEVDALTVKNNAMREAFGYKTEAISATMQGNFAQTSAKVNARNTLVTGGLQAANSIGQGYYNGNRGATK